MKRSVNSTIPPDDGARARPVPLYEHVKRQISEAILLSTWPPGSVLPSEIALAGRYGVAVGTVRRALAELTAEGMLVRRRKTGTMVTGRTPHHTLRYFFEYFRLHGADGSLLRSRPTILSVASARADATEAERLGIAEDAAIIRIHRLRSVEKQPVMHERFALVQERVPGFPLTAGEIPDLLYLHLLERYGLRISAIREALRADLATAEDRALLHLPEPAAILTIDESAFDQFGAPVLISHHRAKTDEFLYLNEIR